MSVETAGLACLRCGDPADPADPALHLGCPVCRAEGEIVGFRALTPRAPAALAGLQRCAAPGLWRWAAALPDVGEPVSLGEGDTPLLELPRLGRMVGLGALYAKNETVNPTWSHKDRLAALAVTSARHLGRRGVVAASTGNHGVSLAAYAARAGIACTVVTAPGASARVVELMRWHGADVIVADSESDRYPLVARVASERQLLIASNATTPPVGSHPYGTAAYKTIAYELWQQLGRAPDWVVIPVSYGDCLAGIGEGFAELHAASLIDRRPRLLGAEVHGALTQGLAGGRAAPVPTSPTSAISIATGLTTFQALHAIRSTRGAPQVVSEEQLVKAQIELAAHEGLAVEAASATVVAAVALASGAQLIQPEQLVVIVLTASALKDPHMPTGGEERRAGRHSD